MKDAHADAANLFADYLADAFRRSPTAATGAGDHSQDERWPDMSKEGDAKDRAATQGWIEKLAALPEADLDAAMRVDREVVLNQLRYALFGIDELKDADWDPVLYTSLIGSGLDPMITREFASLDVRATSLEKRLDGVAVVVAAAKSRLAHSPHVSTETAIDQNRGLIGLCEQEVPAFAAKVPAKKASLVAAAGRCATALHDFQTFLEKDLLPRSDGDFRLGRAKFEKKLRFELGDAIDIDALAAEARVLLETTKKEMVSTSKELWPVLFPSAKLPALANAEDERVFLRKVLDEVAKDRSTNATIVGDAEKLLTAATAFVKKNDLVTVPTEPCRVIEMPEWRRGVAIAYCDSSGPLEANQETFFAISPTPKGWPEKRVESFYREYNAGMLTDLVVHEAMPGHFLQLMHNNRFPSKVRAVYASGAFVEGWAVYSEWLMSKYGFGGPKVRLQRQKMVLRMCVNALLDHDVHAGSMDEKAALSLMMNEAFQEEGEAVGKWKRARLSSAQLTTYFYGFTEMMKIRHALEGKPGFSERAFHDELLSAGSPTMKLARKAMHAE